MKMSKIVNIVVYIIFLIGSSCSLSLVSLEIKNGEIDANDPKYISYNDIPDSMPSEVNQMEVMNTKLKAFIRKN